MKLDHNSRRFELTRGIRLSGPEQMECAVSLKTFIPAFHILVRESFSTDFAQSFIRLSDCGAVQADTLAPPPPVSCRA